MSKAYYLRGDSYLRYGVETDAVDSGYAVEIGGPWPGFSEAGFDQGLDAARLKIAQAEGVEWAGRSGQVSGLSCPFPAELSRRC